MEEKKKNTNYSTEKRTKILDYLKDHEDMDVTVKEIEYALKEKHNLTVNITTIYRYLDKLAAEGTVLKHTDESGKTSTYQYIIPNSECNSHLHMKCSNCGRIYHMDCSFMKDFERHIYEHHKFTLECTKSMLYGICEGCASI